MFELSKQLNEIRKIEKVINENKTKIAKYLTFENKNAFDTIEFKKLNDDQRVALAHILHGIQQLVAANLLASGMSNEDMNNTLKLNEKHYANEVIGLTSLILKIFKINNV